MMDRRTFLLQSGALSAAAIAAETASLAPPRRVLDTHTHFYDVSRPQGVPWPSKRDEVLYRTVMPAEFKTLTAPHNVKATVVIEAVWPVEDNQWALDTLAPDDFVPGIIGRLPLDDSLVAHAERFAAHPKFRGVRVKGTELGEVAPYAVMEKHGWTVDVLRASAVLSELLTLARQVPGLTFVLDHLPYEPLPDAAARAAAETALDGLAELSNVHIKVSNVLRLKRTELKPVAADYADLLDPIWERFGPRRVIFGSNWPVSIKHNGPYADVVGVMNDYLTRHGDEAKDLYFWQNGVRAYGLTV